MGRLRLAGRWPMPDQQAKLARLAVPFVGIGQRQLGPRDLTPARRMRQFRIEVDKLMLVGRQVVFPKDGVGGTLGDA